MRTTQLSRLKELARLLLVLASVIFVQSGATVAQTPEAPKQTTEVEQLKQRLQQLEQVVMDLKGQITAIEETKKKPSAHAIVDASFNGADGEISWMVSSLTTSASSFHSNTTSPKSGRFEAGWSSCAS